MNKVYGIWVDSKLVLTTPHKLKRGQQDLTWDKVRDAVWGEFRPYDKPDCNPLYECGYLNHSGKKVYVTELPQ